MIKLTVNAKELNNVVKFIAGISNKYSINQNETNVKVVISKKSKIIFAAKENYLEVKVPSIKQKKRASS